jgi:NAD+ synthase (glutamine-hydrolysing)
MLVGLAQINSVIGDFDGNREKMLAFVAAATSGAGAVARSGPEGPVDLLVFPELSLCGYPPMDLLDQDYFAEANLAALRHLQRELPPRLAVAVGYVDRNRSGQGKSLLNAVALLRGGELVFSQAKTLLPTYDVFDEARYFEPARERRLVEVAGTGIGVAICEDIWWEEPPIPGLRYQVDPVKELLDAGAELLVVPSASPFAAGKLELRMKLSAKAAREGGIPLLYCNLLGANDSLVFDGRSFALDAEGRPAALAGWEEELLVVDTDALERGAESRKPFALPGWTAAPIEGADLGKDGTFPASIKGVGLRKDWTFPASIKEAAKFDEIERALVLGIRDYMRKCGFKTACLGLSGGIDSALVAVLAAEAIGAGQVTCISMPSRYSSEGSVSDSVALCRNLGMRLASLPIEGPFSAYLALLEPEFEGRAQDLAEENLQARVRGSILMAWSNKFGSLLITTGNKSELAAGYCTLYGDMCGGLAPIGDLLKTEVYGLAEHINARAGRAIIPEATLTKAPSAELRPNQTDQDSLPPYELLDGILGLYIIENLGAAEIVERGYDGALVERVITMVGRAEHKRRQSAPVIKVSGRAFGTGRRIPIARAIYESDPRAGAKLAPGGH